MELLPGGDLRHRLRRAKEPLDGRVLRQIVRDVCCGMAFLHAKATVHGDLKSANVLFNGAGRAKVCLCFHVCFRAFSCIWWWNFVLSVCFLKVVLNVVNKSQSALF